MTRLISLALALSGCAQIPPTQYQLERRAALQAYCLSNPAECARLDQEQQRIDFVRRQAFIRALTGSGDQRTYQPVRTPTQTNTTCSRWGNTAQCQTYSY
jgi:hypothetical protein